MKQTPEQYADNLILEALNVLDATPPAGRELLMLGGELFGSSALAADLPTNPQDQVVTATIQQYAAQKFLPTVIGEAVDNYLSTDEQSVVEYIVSELNSKGYEDFANVILESIEEPSSDNISRIYGIIKQLIKEDVDRELIENIYEFSEQYVNLMEEDTPAEEENVEAVKAPEEPSED